MKNTSPTSSTLVELWTKSTLITRKLDATLGAIHGIGFAEYMVLRHLTQAPNQLLRRIDLAHLLGRSASGITKMLNPMEKIGLVSKEVNPRDARVSLVKITTTGQQVFNEASKSLNQTADHILGRVKPPQVNDLLSLLQALNA